MEDGLIVGFCRPSSLAGRGIGWFGGGYYEHVTTLFPDFKRVIDAQDKWIRSPMGDRGWIRPGVEIRPVTYLSLKKVDWYQFPTSAQITMRVLARLQTQLHKPYDEIGIFDFATGALKDRNWRNESAWFCDELAAWSWEQENVCLPLIYPLSPNRITPGGAALIANQVGAQQITLKF